VQPGLLTSRNFLQNQETTKNIELLEQRILSSEASKEVEKASPTSKITSFLKEDVHGLSFTPMIVLESMEMSVAAGDAAEMVGYKRKARSGTVGGGVRMHQNYRVRCSIRNYLPIPVIL
jgi:hypothetical protein